MNNICRRRACIGMAISAVALCGGCMVGPEYQSPKAPTAPDYVNKGGPTTQQSQLDVSQWWTVFNDPALDQLVKLAYKQNPTLQSAAVRVLEAQARRGIAVGLLFPQQQAVGGSATGNQVSKNNANVPPGLDSSYGQFQLGAAASWELDIWGKYRRNIESAEADVLASIASYDNVLVSLVADVASEYITIRILQERLAVTRANVEVQKRGLEIAQVRREGGTATDLDALQATTLLRDTEAFIPDIEANIRQAQDRLCVLLGIPPRDLVDLLGDKPVIPTGPASVAIGIPADLLRRRPDIRQIERRLASQSANIGVSESNLYPSFSLVGDVRLSTNDLDDLFTGESVQAFGGPTFRWDVLNYGRLENNVRVQDAQFQALIGVYENTVLRAQAEVQSSMSGFLGAQQQTLLFGQSVTAAQRATEIAEIQYRGGIADYTRVLNTQQSLQQEQDRLVSSRGAVALNLVSLYRALGGGWEMRGNRIELDQKIQQQMRARTNWGKMLPVEPVAGPAPAKTPTTKPAI